ncbi:MAG: MmgE/PrpD family protein [Acidiferrobacterales bacterium]
MTEARANEKAVATVFGEWVAHFDLAQAPPTVIRAAKRCLIDVIGVWLAGTEATVARTARDFVIGERAPGNCTVLGTPSRVPATGAAFANAVAAHALDFDDTCYAGIVHGSAVVGPATLAACESVKASGRDFLSAFIAGVEVEYALGTMATDRLYHHGWFSTAVLGSVGAAAGAARAMGLDAEKTANAIALAACQTEGLRVSFGTEAKPYLAGQAAEKGVRAAIFSSNGLLAPALAFEEPRGFFPVLNDGACETGALQQLGKSYFLENPGVAFKRYPVCSAAQAAVEAVAQILTQEGINAQQVARVRCEVTPLVHVSLTYDQPASVSQAQFSMPFAIGCILAFGDLTVEHLSEGVLNDARLRLQMAKVEMRLSTVWKDDPDKLRECPEGARVSVVTADKRMFNKFRCAATGMPSNPMSDVDLARKFRECTKNVLPEGDAERWLARVELLEGFASAGELLAGGIRGSAAPKES